MKISISVIDGIGRIDRYSYDAYNESTDLEMQIENYYNLYGYYPVSVHADKIYRTKENIKYCKGLGIRLSGCKLGCPFKDENQNKKKKKQIKQDERDRIEVEGVFGVLKRRYGLDRLTTKTPTTSINTIFMTMFVLNTKKILNYLFLSLFFMENYL